MTYDFISQVRRIDLNLRAEYPWIATTIFEKENNKFFILVEKYSGNCATLADKFDHKIRFMTVPVELIFDKPNNYIRTIHPIPDDNTSQFFSGLPFTCNQLTNLIQSKFPSLEYIKLKEDFKFQQFHFEVPPTTSLDNFQNIQDFIESLNLVFEPILHLGIQPGESAKNKKGPERHSDISKKVFSIPPSSHNQSKGLGFLMRDEELWMEKHEAIQKQQMTKKDFPFYDPTQQSCFINHSVFSQPINLRNHVLLYDKVYTTLPCEKPIEFLLGQHQIQSSKDLLNLAEMGKIVFVLDQPEERLDQKFLAEAFAANKNSIISRRGVSAFFLSEIVETAQAYSQRLETLMPIIEFIASALGKIRGIPEEKILQELLWPITALRRGFDILHFGGPMGIPSFGINTRICENFILNQG